MSVKITAKENQAKGMFAGGAILENKPIGFPQDRGEQKPFSNLFYWANAWSNNGGLIGEHPHKMFEIMSFVIEGEIQHFDSKLQGWLTLEKGDAQIIRSGNGITHSERLMPGSRIFQIWFDPNIKQSIMKDASYSDNKSDDMYYKEEAGISYKNYVGNGGPMQMDSEGVSIVELTIPKGAHTIKIENSKIHAYYLLDGEASIEGNDAVEHDFIIVSDKKEMEIIVNESARFFAVAVPQKLSYKTYLELVNN